MKTTSTKRAFLLSVCSILLCLVMLVGTTFAWFTDTASTAVNTIQSGKLDVALEMLVNGEWVSAEGKTLEFIKAQGNDPILWEPGCEYKLPDLRIVNKGNLALKYKVVVSGVTGDEKLNEVIDWNYKVAGLTDAANKEGTLNKETTGFLGTLLPEEDNVLTLSGHMQEAAGNEYQNLTITGITVAVYATQYTYEYDSNDNQYDKDADFGEFVTTQDGFLAALAAGKDVILDSDIVLDSELKINASVSIYGNGHALLTGAPVRVNAGNSVTFKNVCFDAPENGKGNASNLYAANLAGSLVLDGCTFTGTQWDCVQVIPLEGASIVINACRFEAASPAQRFIHIQAADFSDTNVKITLTNNFFGSSANLKNSMIDLDYVNLDGIDFGGNNVYTDTKGDIYVCGATANRSIESDEAYKRLGSLQLADTEPVTEVKGNVTVPSGSTVTVNSETKISDGVTISGSGKEDSTLNAEKAKITTDNVTIKDVTIVGSGSVGTGGTLNVNGNNTTLENVDYQGDGNIAIAVSTGEANTGTTFRNTKITNAFRGIQFWSLSGDSLIDNCTLDIAGYTFNIDAAVAGSTLTIRDSTLNGWTSYTSGIQLVAFENCKLGLNAYQYLRPYSKTTITDCEFTSAGYQLNAGGSDAYTITITNCTKNGTKITAENVVGLLLDKEDWNTNATLIVDGTPVTVS